jgi:hypothetical protein
MHGGPRHGQAQWRSYEAAVRGSDGEENGEEGERGRRLAAFESARCVGRRGKRRGAGSVPHGGRSRSEEGPDVAVGSAEWPVVAPAVGCGRWRCGTKGRAAGRG